MTRMNVVGGRAETSAQDLSQLAAPAAPPKPAPTKPEPPA